MHNKYSVTFNNFIGWILTLSLSHSDRFRSWRFWHWPETDVRIYLSPINSTDYKRVTLSGNKLFQSPHTDFHGLPMCLRLSGVRREHPCRLRWPSKGRYLWNSRITTPSRTLERWENIHPPFKMIRLMRLTSFCRCWSPPAVTQCNAMWSVHTLGLPYSTVPDSHWSPSRTCTLVHSGTDHEYPPGWKSE